MREILAGLVQAIQLILAGDPALYEAISLSLRVTGVAVPLEEELLLGAAEGGEEPATGIELLDAMVARIGDVDIPAGVDGDALAHRAGADDRDEADLVDPFDSGFDRLVAEREGAFHDFSASRMMIAAPCPPPMQADVHP